MIHPMLLRLKLAAGLGIAVSSWAAGHFLAATLLASPERFLDDQVARDLTPIHVSRPVVPAGPLPSPDSPPPNSPLPLDPPSPPDPPPVAEAPPADPVPQRACEITKADGTVLHCSAYELAEQEPPAPAPVYTPPGYSYPMQAPEPMPAAEPADEQLAPDGSEAEGSQGPDVVYAGPTVIVGRVGRSWHRAPAAPAFAGRAFGGRGQDAPHIVARPERLRP